MSLLVGAGVAGFLAVGALALGGIALWGESQKDERGYISTRSEPFAAGTHALATDNLDIDLDGAEGLVEATGFGDIRLDVAPQNDKPVFVGIARTGAGPQSLTWEAEDGDWSVVVMNADGSRGVQADINAGAKLPFLSEVGWSALGSGTLLLLTAVALLVLGVRPPRSGARGTPVTSSVPAAT